MKKKVLIISIIIFVVICSVLIIDYLKENHNNTNINELINNKELYKKLSYYLVNSSSSETSIKALVENGLISSDVENECYLLSIDDNKIVINDENCEKAEEYSKIPLLVLLPSEDININEWNNNTGIIKFALYNHGNKYHNENNIVKKTLLVEGNELEANDEIEFVKLDYNENIIIKYEFEDGYVVEKSFMAKFDFHKPSLAKNELSANDYDVQYYDYSGVSKVYYYISKDEIKPEKGNMSESIELKFECNNKYYVWTYAIDFAGNESDVELAGTFDNNC